MKRLLFFILLLAFGADNIYAQKGLNLQIIAQPGISFGGEFDVTKILTSTDTWVAMDKSLTINMNMGAELGYNFTDNMGVSLGLLYSHQGQKFSDYSWTIGNETVSWGRSVSLNYLKIPIQFNYISTPVQNISFMFSTGFYLGFLMSYTDENIISASDGSNITSTANGTTCTQTSTDNSGTTTESAAFVNGNPFNSFDFGGILAAGLQFKLTDKIFLPILLNYQIGFSDVKNQASQFTQSNSSNAELFWQGSNNNSPNATLPYHNSSLGFKIALKFIL
ncbi:MAG: outer membrane beta-barrel protein [Bacteroidetes bacterium]|nr:outer membrane beta-barrel protein [Bacteroidota bacterium]